MSNVKTDYLQRFLLEDLNIRGEMVCLKKTYRDALDRHDYPASAAQSLGEMLAASLLLSATIKFEGALIAQIQSNGRIPLLVAQAHSNLGVKGLAHVDNELSPSAGLFTEGNLIITIKPDAGEPYQGLVQVKNDSITQSIEHYFEQSEQLKTRFWITSNDDTVVALMLQQLPSESDDDGAHWQHIEAITQTLTDEELLSLSPEDILHRLYHEETIRLFEPQPVSFHCDCSQQKVERSLVNLGQQELRSILQEQGQIEVNCDFCNQAFRFDEMDIAVLLTDETVIDNNMSKH